METIRNQKGYRFGAGEMVALTACSNGIQPDGKIKIEELCSVLEKMGLKAWISPCLYAKGGSSEEPKERAKILMDCFLDHRMKGIFDVSGGDLANELLTYLDFEQIKQNPKPFFGYSDLTVLVNAIYQKTGHKTCLYQIQNLVRSQKAWQEKAFRETFLDEGATLFQAAWEFWNGERMQGTVVGGNIRCLLKLAGTEFFPDVEGKILFLEARNGHWQAISSLFHQLKAMHVFERLSGLLLGTFTELEGEMGGQSIRSLLERLCLPKALPVAKTFQIGHGADSRALVIGETLILDNAMKRVYS